MVITKIKGGLGNQMFQYAAGRAFAERTGQHLKVDLSFMETEPDGKFTMRQLDIRSLNVKLDVAPKDELSESILSRAINQLLGRVKFTQINDSPAHRDRFGTASGNVYLDGYWQSEIYFRDVRETLLREFTLRDHIPFNREGIDFEDEKTVAVHVRRGDYVTLASANRFHGVLQMDYYQRALFEIRKKMPHAKVFVFSDDVEWCKGAFSDLAVESFIDGKNKPSAHDLILMSKCAHQVIANSSYSWWAAWLNRNPRKIVIAPQQWFRQSRPQQNSIYCEGWIRL